MKCNLSRFWMPLFCALVLPAAAMAQNNGFEITSGTIVGGGSCFSSASVYVLGGAIGQPGPGTLSGGVFMLSAGFWRRGAVGTGVEVPTPLPFKMYAVAPNPCNPTAKIAFDLPQSGRVQLEIFDLRGGRVRVLTDGAAAPGHHVTLWDGRNALGSLVASGVYVVQLRAAEFEARCKVVLLK